VNVESKSYLEEDRHLTESAAHLSEEALRGIWDNDDDADYDRL
jgi:hypothetical protein